ncbi:hypothetical protein EON64_11810, partial [archaeon]
MPTGATQALYLTLMTLIKPGDEVLMFDPFFELYRKQVRTPLYTYSQTHVLYLSGGASGGRAYLRAVAPDQDAAEILPDLVVTKVFEQFLPSGNQ